MSRPDVSWAFRYSRVFAMTSRSYARASSSQKIAVEPRDARAAHRELDPVADRHVLGLLHAPDVAGLDRVRRQRVALAVEHAHRALRCDLERLVVRAVFLGRLRHESHVADVAHRRHVVGTVSTAVVDDGLVHARVAAVRDQRDHVVQLAVGAVHAARRADGRGHRGVDDHVARHVQVRDALVRIHHRERRRVRRRPRRSPLRARPFSRQATSRSSRARRRGRCSDSRRSPSRSRRAWRTRP